MDRGFGGMGLEVIGSCNASCEFCSWRSNKDVKLKNVYTGEVITRSKGKKIDIDLIDSILEEHQIKGIICTGLSEPFLASDRVLYLADKADELDFSLAIYTNGSLLTKDISEALLDHRNFISINFSLNATTTATRMKVMNLPLEETEKNMMYFLEARRKKGKESDVAVGNVMMLTPNNRSEENEFRRKWKGVFSKYSNCGDPGIFNATNWNGEVDNYWMTSDGNVSGCGQWSCSAPTINVDGQIYLCCYSTHLTFGHCLDPEAVAKWLDRKKEFGVVDKDTRTYPDLCSGCSHKHSNRWKTGG